MFWTRIQDAADPMTARQNSSARQIEDDLVFSCAPANVLSLKGGHSTEAQATQKAMPHIQLSTARRLDLALQFEKAKLTIIGLQEIRGREHKGWDVAIYPTFASPASTKGQCGLEIWIARSFLRGPQAAFVLHADQRRLLIKTYTTAGVLFFFNAHALGSHTYHVDKVRQWWADTDNVLEQHVPACFNCIWLIDANARVGEFPSPAVGNRHPDKQNMQGSLFHDLLMKSTLCLPTTFATDPNGPGTWVSPSGSERRIDFVAIPQQWLCYVQGARVDHGIALAIDDKLDHRLVRVDICLPQKTECIYERPVKAVKLPSREMLKLPCRQAQVQKHAGRGTSTSTKLDHRLPCRNLGKTVTPLMVLGLSTNQDGAPQAFCYTRIV